MKKDKDYKGIIKLLNNDYGWKHFDHNKGLFKGLSGIGEELVNDTIKATKDLLKNTNGKKRTRLEALHANYKQSVLK